MNKIGLVKARLGEVEGLLFLILTKSHRKKPVNTSTRVSNNEIPSFTFTMYVTRMKYSYIKQAVQDLKVRNLLH